MQKIITIIVVAIITLLAILFISTRININYTTQLEHALKVANSRILDLEEQVAGLQERLAQAENERLLYLAAQQSVNTVNGIAKYYTYLPWLVVGFITTVLPGSVFFWLYIYRKVLDGQDTESSG